MPGKPPAGAEPLRLAGSNGLLTSAAFQSEQPPSRAFAVARPVSHAFSGLATPPLDTFEFHRSGIDVDVSCFVLPLRAMSTLPRAPPSYESWNCNSPASEPPRPIWRVPRDAP